MATKRFVGSGPTVDNQTTPSQIVYTIPLDPNTGDTPSVTGGAKTTITASTTSVSIAPANPSRKKLIVSNSSTAILYLDLSGGSASPTSYSATVPAAVSGLDGAYSIDGFTGAVTGAWAAANGVARVTELI